MARRYIKMASPDGTNTVNLYDYALKLPDPYPEIHYTTTDKTYQMRNTASGPGNRVHKSVGTNINHAEIDYTIHSISDEEMTKLKTMYTARPNVILVSFDSGATRYFAKFKESGFTASGYDNNENKDTGKAYFLKAEVQLYILKTTTQGFAG